MRNVKGYFFFLMFYSISALAGVSMKNGNFFVGYTPDGIDGFIKTARKGYFPNAHAELKDPEHVEQRWKAVLTCPDIELIIHGSKVKKPKYCTMNFFLEDLLVEKINKITREYYMRTKKK